MIFACLPRAFAPQDHADCTQQNNDIEQQSTVFNVIKVVRKLAPRVLQRSAVAETHLCAPSYPRTHCMPIIIKGNRRKKLAQKMGRFGTWSDERHVAPEHVPELR